MTTPTLQTNARWTILRVFTSWRMAVVMLTGLACGIPNALTAGTLQVWLAKADVDIKAIGLFALVALPYSLKFLWSPLMDRFVPPFMGRRRGWIVISQAALIAGIAAMAFVGVHHPLAIAAIALAVAFFGASQDIAVDAYRTELLRPEELGIGAGLYILGYRVGLLVSESAAPSLGRHFTWQIAYLLMAASMVIGLLATAFGPEPAAPSQRPRSLREAIVQPFAEFLRRRGAIQMLLFILVFKLDWMMVKGMMAAFITGAQPGALRFSEDAFAFAKALGLFTTIFGAALGGVVITRIGLRRSLWAFGLFQGLAGLSFVILALVGPNYRMMLTAVAVENLCSGMATAAFTAFLMSLCNKHFTATQYALLSSLMTLGGQIAIAPAGWVIGWFGWPIYFVISTLIAIPGLLLLLRFRSWQDGTEAGRGI